jgi:uncharacterized membrane protein YfcA
MSILLLAATGLFAGFFGSMLGIGGGFLIVPVLTLAMRLPIQIAIASSLVAIVANACLAASRYTRSQLTNVKLGLLLCSTTVPGAMVGGLLAKVVAPEVLAVFFGILLVYVAWTMVMGQDPNSGRPNEENSLATVGYMSDTNSYYDKAASKFVLYRIRHIPYGLGGSFFAGVLSTLLGIGGGVIQVPIMNVVMTVPIKIAIGTSTFMIAITTAAGALVYYHNDYVYPVLVAPLVLGTLLGAFTGTVLIERIRPAALRRAFGVLLFITAVAMFLKVASLL